MAEQSRVTFQADGFDEFEELLTKITNEFGYKDAQGILRKAVRVSMQPVLQTAKILAPVDTGAMVASLQIEARKPTRKDRQSKYVEQNDAVISAVTTAPGYKLAKKGIKSDARAVANEFGTAKMAGKPFMRPALESQSVSVLSTLSDELRVQLERYKARRSRRISKGKY